MGQALFLELLVEHRTKSSRTGKILRAHEACPEAKSKLPSTSCEVEQVGRQRRKWQSEGQDAILLATGSGYHKILMSRK